MCQSIEEYLERLRESFKGGDPALLQDAVSDAEEHLQTAVGPGFDGRESKSDPGRLADAIASYGSPEETAAAYREFERRTTLSPSPAQKNKPARGAGGFFSVFRDPRAWSSVFYLILSITGLITGLWALAGLVLSVFTPAALFYLPSIRGIALLEGRIVEALLGIRMPRRPLFEKRTNGWARFRGLLTDSSTWKSIVYFVTKFPFGPASFILVITLVAVSIKGILFPILGPILGRPLINLDSGPVFVPGWMVPLVFVAGCLLLTLTLHLARWLGHIHGRFAKTMLVKKT
jgi:putative sensor protein/HAAS domain-containing protein